MAPLCGWALFLVKGNKDFVDRNLFITIRDKVATCIKPYQKDLDLPHGLALDVLPLDYYPKIGWA